jgi:hypothetical protein
MDYSVGSEMVFTFECFSAEVTFEWSVGPMSSHVTQQVMLLNKGFRTNGALIIPHVGMLGQYVRLQDIFSRIVLATVMAVI